MELRAVGNVWIDRLRRTLTRPRRACGIVDHRSALREMRRATALLLDVAPSSLAPSGKLYEYLVSQRPILCVARPDNRADPAGLGLSGGIAASANDPAAVESAILDSYERWQAGSLERLQPCSRAYSRALLSARP